MSSTHALLSLLNSKFNDSEGGTQKKKKMSVEL